MGEQEHGGGHAMRLPRIDFYNLLDLAVLPLSLLVAILGLMLAPLLWVVNTYYDWRFTSWSVFRPTAVELVGTVLDVALLALLLSL